MSSKEYLYNWELEFDKRFGPYTNTITWSTEVIDSPVDATEIKNFISGLLEERTLNVLYDVSKLGRHYYNSDEINELKDKYLGEDR